LKINDAGYTTHAVNIELKLLSKAL